MRTSFSHPLRIDTISLPGGGRLGLSFCPGKKQADSQTGGWDRDLGIDLDAIRAWGGDAVLTLLETPEMATLGVADLATGVQARGMDWFHVPFANDTVPDALALEKFRAVQPVLSVRLAAGGLFVHCMGGVGRTSVMAALLLLHAGWSAAQAIDAVHQARPGSFVAPGQSDFVEYYAQNYLAGQSPLVPSRPLPG